MIDINLIISNALTAAITSAIAPLNERIAVLEKNEEYLTNRIAALEAAAPQPVGVDPKTLAEASLNYLNDQEWFWSKINDYVERQMDDHLQTYDHDSYDSHIGDDDKHFDGDIDDAVRESIGNLTFEVSVS